MDSIITFQSTDRGSKLAMVKPFTYYFNILHDLSLVFLPIYIAYVHMYVIFIKHKLF